jgi:hypothetical protein
VSALNVLREGIQWAHQLLDSVMVDVTPEQAHQLPPGTAHPIAAIYAHALLAEDGIVNGMLRGAAPLYTAEWSTKAGIREPNLFLSPEWSRALRVDLDAARQYSQAVSASTEAYLASLSPEELERPVDLSNVGLGQRTVAWILNALVAGHLNNMAGELSCLKGMQGLKGYPY